MKKLFFVADAQSVHTAKWVDYFIEQGFDTYLATFAQKNITKCNSVFFLSNKNVNNSGGNYHYLLSINKLANIFKEIQPSYINAHFSYSMGLIALLAKNKSKINSSFSIVCHGSDILANPLPLIFDRINKDVLNRCDKIFAVSDQIKDKINSWNIDLNKVFTGQYGVEGFEGCCSKKIDILSNRNYVPNSRIEMLLESLEFIKDKNYKIVFVLPHIDNNKLDFYKKNYPFIEFYSKVPYEQMIEMVKNTRLYISATKSDGLSLSLLEAMSMGAVPIVSNIVSNRSVVLDNVNGYLFDTKSEFKHKLEQAISGELETAVDINKKLIKDKYLYNDQMLRIKNFLTEN